MSFSVRSLAVSCLFAVPMGFGGCSGEEDPFASTATEGGGTDSSDSAATSGSPTTDNTSTSGSPTTNDTATSGSPTTNDTVTTGQTTGPTTGSTTGATTDSAGTTTDNTAGSECRPVPTRYIVLGDSVPNGTGTGGPNGAQNGFKIAADYLRDTYAGGSLEFLNYSVGGAVTTDVPDNQLDNIEVGIPGHVLVNIHIGGNDLQPYIYTSDQEAEDGYAADIVGILQDWDTMWAFFNDAGNFPDGVTVVVNGQYNPWDDCLTPYFGITISEIKIGLIQEYNDEIQARTLSESSGAFAATRPMFLGHGHNYNKPECPYYMAGADSWMIGGFDFIHAGVGGHAAMAGLYSSIFDGMYGGSCG